MKETEFKIKYKIKQEKKKKRKKFDKNELLQFV